MVTYEFLSDDGQPCDTCLFCAWCETGYFAQEHKPGTCYHIRERISGGDIYSENHLVVCADCLREKGLIW